MKKRILLLAVTVLCSEALAQSGARYLIITNDTFYDAIQPLAAWKNQKGMKCAVAKLSETGNTSTNIRDYIHQAYLDWNPRPEYVLLVGGGANLPAIRYSTRAADYTDNDYGDMTGDFRAEIPIGRFPCRTPAQCSVMVAKTLAYEQAAGSDSSWYLRGTTIARDGSGNAYDDSIYKANVSFAATLALAAGYQDIDSLSYLRGSTADSVVQSVNSGTSFVLYRGAATANWYTPFAVNPAQTDNGPCLPIVCSFTCQTLGIGPYTTDSMVATGWMTVGTPGQLKGAVAFIGNSHSGSEVAWLRSPMARGYFTGVFPETIATLGWAMIRGKEQVYQEYPDTNGMKEYRGFNLFGDPELGIRTRRPMPLVVTHDSVLLTGWDTLHILVTSNGEPVPNALVCATDTSGTYEYDYTDGNGRLALAFNLTRAGVLQVTATARNARPWTGTVPVRLVDVGVTQVLAPAGDVDSGTAITPRAQVINRGDRTETFPIDFRIDDGNSVTITRTVAAGADSVFAFPDWTPRVRGSHVVRCSTRSGHDANDTNNSASANLNVLVHDVAAGTIIAPTGTIPPGPVAPQARLHNCGTLREPVNVTFSINSSTPYQSTIGLWAGLPVAADTIIVFPSWTGTEGDYTARCSVFLAREQVPGNNVVATGFRVGTEDVGVQQIIGFSGVIDTAAAIVPVAEVKNYGEVAASFEVFFQISALGLDGIYCDSNAVTGLAPGASSPVVFREWPKPHPLGFYAARCSTYVSYDHQSANDTLGGRLRIIATPSDTGWSRLPDVPLGPKSKRIKDGGCLAGDAGAADGDTGFIYALKGSNTCEFYRFNPASNTWTSRESIPAVGSSGKKKRVKKGATLVAANDRIYAAKGNNTAEWWAYAPGANAWTQMTGLPGALKQGAGAAAAVVGDTTWIYVLRGTGSQEFYRFNTVRTTSPWEKVADAPLGVSGKTYKKGSCLAGNGTTAIYALKGDRNEFYQYDIAANAWNTMTSLPLIGSSGRKKKGGDGSGIAWLDQRVYALKGNNTNEFWAFTSKPVGAWSQLANMPLVDKNVKAGGALIPGSNALYAVRGNNTLEFYVYKPLWDDESPRRTDERTNVAGSSTGPARGFLSINPNPFSRMATVSYSLPEAGNISLKLYDVTGKLVTTLATGYHSAGGSSLIISRSMLSSGIYLLKLEAGNLAATTKLIIE